MRIHKVFGTLCILLITGCGETESPQSKAPLILAPVAGIGDSVDAFEKTYNKGYKKDYGSPLYTVKVGKSEEHYMSYDGINNFGNPSRIGLIQMDTSKLLARNSNEYLDEQEFYRWVRNILPRDAVLIATYLRLPGKMQPWKKRYHIFRSASLAAIPGAPDSGTISMIVNWLPDKSNKIGNFLLTVGNLEEEAKNNKLLQENMIKLPE